MIKFTFERICFKIFAFDVCEFFLASSHPYCHRSITDRYLLLVFGYFIDKADRCPQVQYYLSNSVCLVEDDEN